MAAACAALAKVEDNAYGQRAEQHSGIFPLRVGLVGKHPWRRVVPIAGGAPLCAFDSEILIMF